MKTNRRDARKLAELGRAGALPWATRATTGYPRDSSSKRPMSSVTFEARARHRPWKLPRPLYNRSFHIRPVLRALPHKKRGSQNSRWRSVIRPQNVTPTWT